MIRYDSKDFNQIFSQLRCKNETLINVRKDIGNELDNILIDLGAYSEKIAEQYEAEIAEKDKKIGELEEKIQVLEMELADLKAEADKNESIFDFYSVYVSKQDPSNPSKTIPEHAGNFESFLEGIGRCFELYDSHTYANVYIVGWRKGDAILTLWHNNKWCDEAAVEYWLKNNIKSEKEAK